ncbi:MAG: 4-hydroxy-tetrahydrodipicolinate synthase [Acholeplasmatales bacterium]|nr:4-hydroxy-tetrahydrodipicolinate synthase [Acholeplasmatales bacterium]
MLKGSIVALVTPFNNDGSVNFEELGNLLEYHIANNSGGIVILGTTGEASTLSFEEEAEIVEYSVKKINKRVPLIVGSGSNETEKAVRMSKKYSEMGADYVLVITPYYNKTNESGLIKHFQAVADASLCPVIMYNVPGRTGMSMSIHALEVLSKHPNICGIKEASGNISYSSKVAKLLSNDFAMYSGNDDIIVPMMSIGAMGVISVVANIAPKQTAKIVDLCLEGEYVEANKLQQDLLDLINDLFIEVNPIPVKEAMNYLGMNVGGYRMPLDYMSEGNKKILTNEIDRIKELIY